MKALIVTIGIALTLALYISKRYLSIGAKKRKLRKKIRKLEREMALYDVGSGHYKLVRSEWVQLNEEWGDLIRNP